MRTLGALLTVGALLWCGPFAVSEEPKAGGSIGKEVFRKLEGSLIGRTLSTEGKLVEDYKDKGFAQVSGRTARFCNLRQHKEGFTFDLILDINAEKIAAASKEVMERKPQNTLLIHFELRPLDADDSCVGFSKTVLTSDSAGDKVGEAESCQVRVIDNKIVLVQKDLWPRLDPNDNVLVTSETTCTLSESAGSSRMDVHYVEHEYDAKLRGAGKKRFDVDLVYTEKK